jgi:hypothetical protein
MCGHSKFVVLQQQKIPYELAADWILRHNLSLASLVEEGKKLIYTRYGFTIPLIHLFPDWKLLANNPNYARQIISESKKLDYEDLCSDFKVVLQACYDTLSNVDLSSDIKVETVTEIKTLDRELVTA